MAPPSHQIQPETGSDHFPGNVPVQSRGDLDIACLTSHGGKRCLIGGANVEAGGLGMVAGFEQDVAPDRPWCLKGPEMGMVVWQGYMSVAKETDWCAVSYAG